MLPPIRSLSNDLHPIRQSHINSPFSSADKRAAPQPQSVPAQDLSVILRDVGLDPLLCRELVNCACQPPNIVFL